jgi:hypothetical protein
MNTASGRSAKLGQWCGVVVFAVAMAWVESAVVLYLRSLTHEFDPYQPDQTPLAQGIVGAELVREFATLLMLGSVGWLAGQTWRSRVGLAMVAFGVWDIFYYVFLVPLTGWPRSLLDWDILFLLPLPWWGPVLAPMSIACLMVAGGTMVALRDSPERPIWPSRYTCLAALVGGGLALYVFMADAIHLAPQEVELLMELRPERFDWPLFLLGLVGLTTPVAELAWRARATGWINEVSCLDADGR